MSQGKQKLAFYPAIHRKQKLTVAIIILTRTIVRLEALLEEGLDVGESIFFHLLDVLSLWLRSDIPRESPTKPVNYIEQENFEITSSRKT
jgi:hypothetical protein